MYDAPHSHIQRRTKMVNVQGEEWERSTLWMKYTFTQTLNGNIADMQHESLSSPSEPLSYWQNTAPALQLSTSLPSHVDILIIGGGLLGASTCYWLARNGHPVTLLEHTMPAFGATGRNGGFVSIGLDEPYANAIAHLGHETAHAILSVTLDNRTLLRQVIQEEHITCDYREPGHIHLSLSQEDLEVCTRSSLALQQDGVATTILAPSQLQAFIHTPPGSRIVGAMFTPHNGLVHPAKLVQGLLTAAQRHGAHIVRAEAQHLHHEKDAIHVQTNIGTITAKRVLVATNAWIANLLPQLKSAIIPVRGQVLAYEPVPPVFSTGVGVNLSGTGEYWQQAPDGTIVLGGCRTAAEEHDIGINISQPTMPVQNALEQVFPQLFPQLSNLHVSQRWAGLMAFTPDRLPIADTLGETSSIWMTGGFSGHGMPYGLRFGQLLAEALTTQKHPSELRPFRLNRKTLK